MHTFSTVQQQMKSTCHHGLTLLMDLHITTQKYMNLSIGRGHESRLDRLGLKNKSYAFEELVAEMGASFMMAQLGLEPTARDDHAQYIIMVEGIEQ